MLRLLVLCLFLTPTVIMDGASLKSVRVDGDIIIGALFPVHRPPNRVTAFTKQCGEMWETYGVQRVQMLFMTLDVINNSTEILPNITLGCDIRDSCWYAPIALEQTIDFIKDSIASIENQNQNASKNATSPCASDRKRGKPIAGLIGPASSTVTIQVQNFFQLFHVPQIGYSATSKDLSRKDSYKYFMRVVPSDVLQAKALRDFVKFHNWTYISAVASEGNYGTSGMNAFVNFAKEAGICVATEETVAEGDNDAAYDKVILSLYGYKNSEVVVCFCEGMVIRKLYMATKRLNLIGHFTIIGSDGWNDRKDVIEQIEDIVAGGFSVRLHSPEVPGFDERWLDLTVEKAVRNPWFKEFWQFKFQCNIPDSAEPKKYNKTCTGKESLRKAEYKADAKLGFVVNALWTMAIGLHSLQREVCGPVNGICDDLLPINGTSFLKHLLKASFVTYSDNVLYFDANGDPPGRYDILNFKPVQLENGSYEYHYVQIGNWDAGNITVDTKTIHWARGRPFVESVCSKPCPKGEIKQMQQGRDQCCWVCTPCKENEILLDETRCRACDQGWWPNDALNACLPITIEFIEFKDTKAVCCMIFSAFGVFVTVCIIVCFLRHNDTPVVKASTRELTYLILVGCIVAYCTSFTLITKPSISSCYLSRILPGFAFSMIFGALVTKTNRIARILAGSKKKIMTRKPRFMSASAQVVITCMIVGIECAIITVMLVLEPADSAMDYSTKRQVKLICNTTSMGIIVPLGFDLGLIAMCTIYAVRTRNVPENFNEAKFIGFTMYTTCVIWGAFVPIYYGSDNRVITMCVAISLTATVALVLLFFPKIYIILCKPERNNRSAFTTSKDVRCHIGSQMSGGTRSYCNSLDSGDVARQDKVFEQAALDIYRQKNFFDKWKNRSGSQPSGRGHVTFTSRLGSAGNIYKANPSPRPPAKASPGAHLQPPYRSGGRYESIPMRDVHDSPVASLRFPIHEKRQLDTPGSPDANHLNIDKKCQRKGARAGAATPSPRINVRHDSSCQTDDDLIYSVSSVRQRKVAPPGTTSSNSSSRSRNSARKASRGVNTGASGGGNGFYQSTPSMASAVVNDEENLTDTMHCAQITDRHPLLNTEASCESGSDGESYTNAPEDSQPSGQQYCFDSFVNVMAGSAVVSPSTTRHMATLAPSTPGRSRSTQRGGPSTPVVGRGIVPRPSSTGLIISNLFANPAPRTASKSPRERRKAPSPSSLDSDSDSRHNSREDVSKNGMKGLDEEEKNVARFHDYLVSKGVKLDLTNVQSSEV